MQTEAPPDERATVPWTPSERQFSGVTDRSRPRIILVVTGLPSHVDARVWPIACAAAIFLFPLCACAENPPFPARAAQLEQRQCEAVASAKDAPETLDTLTVLKAEPQIHVATCSGAAQVFGVKLLVRPRPGESADQLVRNLRCHKARAMLGRLDSPRLADDPFWLPNSWVTIDVKPEAGNLLLTLGGDTVTDNLVILHRATAFAAQHGPR